MTDHSAIGLLLDRYRLSRIRQTFGRRVDEFEVAVDPDPTRLSLVADPFVSMADVRERLEALETLLLEQADRRSVFLTVYTRMTVEMIDAIDADEFADTDWMTRYLVRFAEYYRRAFKGFERGAYDEVPDPWIVAFGTAMRGDALIVHDALLGINAHINYDLGLTLSEIGLDPNRSQKYMDHVRVNEILQRLVSVQRELLAERYAPGLSRVGDHLAGLDEHVSSIGLQHAREQAWYTAVVRTDVTWLPVGTYTEWLLRRTATGGAYLLLQPKTSPATMRVLRDLEADEIDLVSLAEEFHARA